MFMRVRVARASSGKAFIACLVLALLLAQGMRLCLHSTTANSSHIESTLSAADGHDDHAGNSEITFFGLLVLSAMPVLAAVLVVLLSILAPSLCLGRVLRARDPRFRPPHGHYLTPPLRAPPR